MKITPEHYEHIADAINSSFDKKHVAIHREFINQEWTRNRVGPFAPENVEKRLRWDLLWLSVPASWICDNIYKYADDTHIDTVLKKILKELEE